MEEFFAASGVAVGKTRVHVNLYDRVVAPEENRGKISRRVFVRQEIRLRSLNWVREMKIEAGSLAELNQWIPAWLSSLSLARGQIVVDQISGFLERSTRCHGFGCLKTGLLPGPVFASPLVFLICTDTQGQRFGVLAVQSFSVAAGHLGADRSGQAEVDHDADTPNRPSGILGDSATILHAGPWIDPSSKTTVGRCRIS